MPSTVVPFEAYNVTVTPEMPLSPASWMPLSFASFHTKSPPHGRLVHAGIDRVIRLTRRERNRITHARRDIGIAVLARVTPLILRTDRISARRREPHIIRARRQSREVIQTIRIRRRRAQHRRPIRGVQRHRHFWMPVSPASWMPL